MCWQGASALTDTFVEIIGNVSDAGSLKMFSCVNMGEELGEHGFVIELVARLIRYHQT